MPLELTTKQKTRQERQRRNREVLGKAFRPKPWQRKKPADSTTVQAEDDKHNGKKVLESKVTSKLLTLIKKAVADKEKKEKKGKRNEKGKERKNTNKHQKEEQVTENDTAPKKTKGRSWKAPSEYSKEEWVNWVEKEGYSAISKKPKPDGKRFSEIWLSYARSELKMGGYPVDYDTYFGADPELRASFDNLWG